MIKMLLKRILEINKYISTKFAQTHSDHFINIFFENKLLIILFAKINLTFYMYKQSQNV